MPYTAQARSSPYFQIALYAAGNVLAVAICLLCWFAWDLLSAFQVRGVAGARRLWQQLLQKVTSTSSKETTLLMVMA
jgi:hypothetical protein